MYEISVLPRFFIRSYLLKYFPLCDIISFMKKIFCFVLILTLSAAILLGAVACKSEIVTDEPYSRYVYDARTDTFVQMGATLTFKDDFTTFEYSIGDGDLTVFGAVEHTDTPNAYTVTCNEEATVKMAELYRKRLVANGAEQSELDFFDTVAAYLTPTAQYFVYEGKLLTGDAVELFREPEDDSDSFEGLYRMDSSEDLVRLRGGYAYAKDDDGEYTFKSGKYSVSRGILTLISLDENGNEKYKNGILMRKRYLMAKITVPSEGTLLDKTLEDQMESSAFVSKLNADISAYSGKTIAVLCDSFLSNDMG